MLRNGNGNNGNDVPAMPAVVPKMRPELVDQMVVQCLRNPQITSYALHAIKPDYFTIEPHYRVLWPVFVSQSKKYGMGEVPYTALAEAVLDAISMSPEALTPDEFDAIGGSKRMVERGEAGRLSILHYAYYEATEDELNHQMGLDLLQRFLQERAISADAYSKFVVGAGRVVPGDIEEFLVSLMGRLASVKAIGQTKAFDLSDPLRLAAPIMVRTTGVPFLDLVMDGGHAPGETHLVLSPQKGGKTMLAVQMATATAELAYRAVLRGEEPLYAYHFSYEEALTPDLENRYYSCGARILRRRLKYDIHEEQDMSHRGNLFPYEVAMFRDCGEDMSRAGELPGEYERLISWKETAGRYLKLFDLRLKQDSKNGGGGINEIVQILNAEAAFGRKPGIVVVDYVTKAVENQMIVEDLHDSQVRRAIINYVGMAESHVAVPFKVPVWLLQQYGQEAQGKSAATLLNTSMAGESKTIGANVNFAFCLGNRDTATQVAQLLVDRARRSESQGQVLQLHFNGDYGCWDDVSGKFDVNSVTGTVTAKAKGAVAAGISAEAKQLLAVPSAPSADPFVLEAEHGGYDEDMVG